MTAPPQPHAKSSQKAIPSLTGIRGAAAVWVLMHHLQNLFPELIPKSAFGDAGYRGVDLFFILSGFILMYVHMKDFARPTLSRVGHFYLARFFRVYPLNAAILLGILLLLRWNTSFVTWSRIDQPAAYSVAGFFQTLFLANRWFRQLGEWDQPTWSLSLEIVGYLIFPLLVFAIVRLRRMWMCIAVCVGSLAALLLFQFATHSLYFHLFSRVAVVRMLLCFICGIGLCRLRNLEPAAVRTAKFCSWASCFLIVACVFDGQLMPLIVFPFAGLIWALSYDEGMVNAAFGSTLAVYLGRISFALYLVHIPVLRFVEYLLATSHANASLPVKFALLGGGVAASFGVAVLLHHWVELPMHRVGRRLARRTVSSHEDSSLVARV